MGVGIVAASLLWWFRCRRATIIESRRSSTIKAEPSTPGTIESKVFELSEAGNEYIPRVYEMPSTPGVIGPGEAGNVYIPPQEQQARAHEMPSTPVEVPRYEMEAGLQLPELPTTECTDESLRRTK